MQDSPRPLIDEVRDFWEKGACGHTRPELQSLDKFSPAWYERMEQVRYELEPFIFSIAQFPRHRDKDILEIGVGAGTDHLQFARSGARCHGVDLTDEGIKTTAGRLALHGFESKLQRVNSESLPFPDHKFDTVYSWGVIHHSENPQQIIDETWRVLKPGGQFAGMLYGRYSPHTLKMWVRFALLTGRPWRTFRDVIWHHVESLGTQCYTQGEIKNMFKSYSRVETTSLITPYDTSHFPKWMHPLFPQGFGWFIGINAWK